MTPTNPSVEPISSDPVIIDSSETQDDITTNKTATAEKPTKKEDDFIESVSNLEVDVERRPFERPIRVIRNRRNYSPPPPPSRFGSAVYEVPSLVNTATLNDLINEPDTCADTIDGHLIYITNTAFHAVDLEKISWILKIGIQDTWVQKPVGHLTANGFQFDLPPGNSRRRNGYIEYEDRYDDGYDMPRGRGTPIIRLGNALRVFKTDEKKYGAEKVKFVIAVQGKGNAGWLKLVVSHSRQAAAVDIFHEILNNHSILFVGAVLQDVVIPVEAPNRQPAVKFQRVGSLKEAEAVREGVIGVVC